METSEQRLTAYTGDPLQVQGTIELECYHKERVIKAVFYVVESSAPPLIGLQSSLDLGLLTLTYSVERNPSSAPLSTQSVQKDYTELFQAPGTSKLYLEANAVPVVNPPRRIPEALKSKLKVELDCMEKDRIIEKVSEPTGWVNSMVVVEKP